MSGMNGAIDHFYEVIPGLWLLIGWSSLAVIKHIDVETAGQQSSSVSICPVRLPRLDVAQAFNDERFNQAGFVAFLSGDGCSEVQSVVLGQQSVACHPLPLPPDCSPWPSRLKDLLNVLQVQNLSIADLKLLLQSGLLKFVVEGARDWNSLQAWKDYGFERQRFGCQHGELEITLVLVMTTPSQQPLLEQLERLCWDTWCIGGRVHVLLICDRDDLDQCDSSVRLSEALQGMLCLEQISLDLIVPDHRLGLFDCLNFGVHLAQTDIVIVDPSCLIFDLSAFITCMRGPALLEPERLIVADLNNDDELVSAPMWFRRDCFFDLGGFKYYALDETFASKQLRRSFESTEEHGVRHVDDLPVHALRNPSLANGLSLQSAPLQFWQIAFKTLLFGA